MDSEPHDWEADPRPFAECLAEWATQLNGGRYGARKRGATELRVPAPTYADWLSGKPPQHERIIRRLMTLIASGSGSEAERAAGRKLLKGR